MKKGTSFGGNLSVDIELAQTAGLTIATTEKVVSHQEIVARGADIIGLNVHKVVLAPRGAYPTSCYPEYQLDGLMFIRYIEACQENRFWPLWLTSIVLWSDFMAESFYTADELMVSQISHSIRTNDIVFQGFATFVVFAAFILAKLTHALTFISFTALVTAWLMWRETGISRIEELTSRIA